MGGDALSDCVNPNEPLTDRSRENNERPILLSPDLTDLVLPLKSQSLALRKRRDGKRFHLKGVETPTQPQDGYTLLYYCHMFHCPSLLICLYLK